jgi:hypothetical protein
MNRQQMQQLLPLLSVSIVIVSLFTLVFLQMETRRMGYVVLRQTRAFKALEDQKRLKTMRYARLMRPDHIRDLAVNKLTLNEVKAGQIIHMSGEKIIVRQ